MDSSYHIALTGHRPARLAGYNLQAPFYKRLRSHLDQMIAGGLETHEHLTLHSGLALGADSLWSHAILDAKQQHPDRIDFIAEVPFMAQSKVWPVESDRRFWQHQIDSADLVNVYSSSYSPEAMQLRNEGMVDACNMLLAIWDGSTSGGTYRALRYAQRLGKTTLVTHPDAFR